MSTSRRSARPVIVEVKPDHAAGMAPSSPTSPRVRFAPTSAGLVTGVSRPLTAVEAWSLYHFENHARSCDRCYDPIECFRRSDRLCREGHALAQDVAFHVYYRDGEIYSTQKHDSKSTSKLVRVEIPPAYSQLRSLLKAVDRALRSPSRRAEPVISYDRTYPNTTRPRRRASYDDQDAGEAILEPASSSKSHRSNHHRSRYSTTIVDDAEADNDRYAVREPTYTDRRGTLYEKDMQQRKKEAYRVEIRQPSAGERSSARRERPRSEFWV